MSELLTRRLHCSGGAAGIGSMTASARMQGPIQLNSWQAQRLTAEALHMLDADVIASRQQTMRPS